MLLRPYELIMPPVVPAVVGHEVNVYFDNLICGEATRYDFDVNAPIGRHRNEGWTCVPEEPGDYPLTVEVYSEEGERLDAGSTIVRVKAADSGAGSHRRVMFIGDSTTGAGQYTAELLRLFSEDPADLTLVGTRGTAPNVHEGRGGWKVKDYWEHPESPFLFDGGTFDFARYMETHGRPGLDDVCIHLGINDAFHFQEEGPMEPFLLKNMTMLEAIVADIHKYDANIRIGMMLVIPPSRTQDSFGRSYGAIHSRRKYKRKWFQWNRELLARFSGRSGIELIPMHVNLDSARNMPTESARGNARNPRSEIIQSNGVHPAVEGYQQMADMLYAWLKA